MIDDVFNNRDVAIIKRVPIPINDTQDNWFWVLDDKGDFTVKSAYRWSHGEFENVHKKFLNKLWYLKLPGKVSHCIWHVCK